MPDFTPSPFDAFATAFQQYLDAALEAKKRQETPRDYLGGSRLGEDCLRALGYEYFQVPKDADRNFKGETLRIFDMGSDIEIRMAGYLRAAGFELVTHRPDGKQIGFGIAPSPKTGRNRIGGNIDGVVTLSPMTAIVVPCLWECKGLGAKSWNKTLREGVKRSKPVYYAQMQTYMAYLDLSDNPALFTAQNRDTGEIYAELVPFDLAAAQEASDRGVRVVTAGSPEDLPRVASTSTDYRCRYCPYEHRCWHQLLDEPPAPRPGWIRP